MNWKSDQTRFLLCLLFFAVLAAITFRCAWPADHVFNASDMNIGRLAAKKHALPEMLTGYYTGNQVMGTAGSQFTLFNLMLSIFPLVFFANTFYAAVLILGSLSMVWFLRIQGRGWLVSVCGALIAFWFNSITLASGGHTYKMEVLFLSVLSLCFIERCVRAELLRRAIGWSILTGLSIGIMMIEQQDVALLAGLFVGPYAIFRLIQTHLKEPLRWLGSLAPIAIVSLALSGSTLLGSYKTNIAGAASVQKSAGDSGEKWNFITQWSMVPSEWPDLIAAGWSGWSSGNPKGPYWGVIGQSAEWEAEKKGFQNFKLDSAYMGFIPFFLGAVGLVLAIRNRKTEEAARILFWGAAGLIALFLAFGKYSPLYKLFFHIPLFGDIRAPIKLLDNFQICMAIIAAYALDLVLKKEAFTSSVKRIWIASAGGASLLLLAGLKTVFSTEAFKARLQEMNIGGDYAEAALSTMTTAWFHAALLAFVCAALVFLVWSNRLKGGLAASLFIVVLACDSLLLTSKYFTASDISGIRKGNVVINHLAENQGNERAMFMDQQGLYNQWIASDGPYHDLNLFNIWQMPRMPVIYKKYLGSVGRNQVRLWQLSAVKYVAMPQQVLQQNPGLGNMFKPALNYQVPTTQGMRKDALLEFKGAIPRFALYRNWETLPLDQHCARLIAPGYNPTTGILVDAANGVDPAPGKAPFEPVSATTTKRSATITVNAAAPSILRFSQRFQGNWTVLVDGQPSQLLRVDFLSMGVQVPAGEHTIEFRCPRSVGKRVFMIAVFISALLGAIMLLSVKSNSSTAEG